MSFNSVPGGSCTWAEYVALVLHFLFSRSLPSKTTCFLHENNHWVYFPASFLRRKEHSISAPCSHTHTVCSSLFLPPATAQQSQKNIRCPRQAWCRDWQGNSSSRLLSSAWITHSGSHHTSSSWRERSGRLGKAQTDCADTRLWQRQREAAEGWMKSSKMH